MLQPPFTEAHESFRAQAREFVLGELRPHAEEWEEAGWFPNDVFRALGARGWLGLKYGGDPVADAVLAEELARCGSGGVPTGIGAHVHIATPPIHGFGTDEIMRAPVRVGPPGSDPLTGGRLSALGCWLTAKVRLTDLSGSQRPGRVPGHAWSHCAQSLPPCR